MPRNDVFSKSLAVVGTVLVWPAIVAPILFALIRFAQDGRARFDWLMPAEMFPLVLAGGVLLVWAALRSGTRRRPILWGFGIALGMLVAGQALAVATGLASGETEPDGWAMIVVTATIAIYALATLDLAVWGILLIRDLFRRRPEHDLPTATA